jgi:signal transduction histidine kinase
MEPINVKASSPVIRVLAVLSIALAIVIMYFWGISFGLITLSFAASLITIWTDPRPRWSQTTLTVLACIAFLFTIVIYRRAGATQRELDAKTEQFSLTSDELAKKQVELSATQVKLNQTTNDLGVTTANLGKDHERIERILTALDAQADTFEQLGAKRRAKEVRAIRERIEPYPLEPTK